MCCFSRPINDVSATKIFCSMSGKRQFIVYSMDLDSDEDVAMVLPIPASVGSSVDFISFEHYPKFFDDMYRGFEIIAKALSLNARDISVNDTLKVEKVGAYEASFVPTANDFDRLDRRFSIPSKIWNQIERYEHFGFVVFRLAAGKKSFHPMAFSFETEIPERIFFPTMHIHDGEVHEYADYDHTLYYQPDQILPDVGWRESNSQAESFIDIARARGVVDGSKHIYSRGIHGKFENVDILARS